MAEQIIQTLGFDAGDALTTLRALTTELSTFNGQLQAVAQSAQLFNKNKLSSGFTRTAKSAKDYKKSLDGVSKSTKGAGKNIKGTTQSLKGSTPELEAAANSLKEVTISWKTLSRVVATQTVIRVFNLIKDAIGESITNAIELQKRIGEIQTIAGNRLGDNIQLDASLTATSTTFGFDILDVAEAKYQELSNQVKGSTESLEFQEAAAKLARATNSSLADSVNLLSSSLNAFGKDASQSNETAGILFKTIEQGRVRAGELANTLGRVAPLANSLGVSFNELGGAIARITQGGTKADTALTQVLGILNKLSKPTPELAAAFKELGVATASEGIQQSGGLLPFLQSLQKVAGDSGTLVEFFNNVRAIQGVLSLLKTDADQTGRVFEAIGFSAEEAEKAINEAFSTATTNDAVQYEKAIQQLNASLREMGKDALPLAVSGVEGFNSVFGPLIRNLGTAVTVTTGVTIGTLAFSSAMGTATGSAAVFSGALGVLGVALKSVLLSPAGAFLVGIAAGLAAINYAQAARDQQRYGEGAEIAAGVLKDLNQRLEESSLAAKRQAQSFRDAGKEVVSFTAKFRDLRRDALKDVQNVDRNFVASSEATLNQLLSVRTQYANEIAKVIKSADKDIQKSVERTADLQARKDDFLLDRRIKNLDENRRALALFEASREKAFDTRDLIKGATDLQTFDGAAKALETRLDLAQKGLAAADASGNVGAIARAEEQVATALNDQINLEKQRRDIIRQRQKIAEAEQAKEIVKTEQLKKLTKDIRAQLTVLNKSGGLLNQEGLDRSTAEVENLIGRLSDFALNNKDIDFAETLGIQNLASQLQQQLTKVQATVLVDRNQAIDQVKLAYEGINEFVDDNAITIGVKLGLIKGGGVDQFSDLVAAQKEAEREIDGLTEAQNRYNTSVERVAASQQLLRNLLEGTTAIDDTSLEIFNKTVESIATNSAVSVSQVQAFADSIREAATAGNLVTGSVRIFDVAGPSQEDTARLEQFVQAFRNLQAARANEIKARQDTDEERFRLQQLQLFQDAATRNAEEVRKIGEGLDGATNKAGQFNEKVFESANGVSGISSGWGTVIGQINDATSATKEYNRQLLRGIPQFSPSTVTNRMFGGPIYRNAGGAARGQDKIPAMLSAGEFVMNSGSSRKFASQLVAMNAGANPTYRSEGGSISNTVNVGDINVNGTANADDTARQVVSQLRREFRRGTASRFN